jgi:hypothetical protein
MSAKLYNPNLVFIALALLALTSLSSPLSTVFGQGSLTPPGAPAPTMKSLDQIEARTPISGLPYTISSSGSYYFTTNLTAINDNEGITIAASDVTLDLNGFTLHGAGVGLGEGIQVVYAVQNLVIRNGVVDAWEGNAVDANTAYNSQFDFLRVGSSYGGLVTGSNCVVSRCIAGGNSSIGIEVGASSVVKDCIANANNGDGIYGNGDNCVIEDCMANANGRYGIAPNDTNCIVRNCTANLNGATGLYVPGSCNQIIGNTCNGNKSYGILIGGTQNRVDDNNVGNNVSYGIADNNPNGDNFITRNISPGKGYEGYNTGNSDYAPIQSPTNAVASPWANFQ